MTANEILTISKFLGDSKTKDQAERLLDEVLKLSASDREWLLEAILTGNSTPPHSVLAQL
jgi:hypothetical protein